MASLSHHVRLDAGGNGRGGPSSARFHHNQTGNRGLCRGVAPGDCLSSHHRGDVRPHCSLIADDVSANSLSNWALLPARRLQKLSHMNQARRVKDVMNPDIMTVADDMTTDELVRYLAEREI